MKKYLALLLAALTLCAMLAGCAQDTGDAPILENTATPTAKPSATATPTAKPTATPTVAPSLTPTPTVAAPTPNVSDDEVQVVDAGFDKLYKEVDYVLIGKLTKSLGEWNQCRDVRDPSKAHASIFMMEKQYTVEITEVLKGKGLKAKDSITLSLPYRDKFEGEKDYTMRSFQEPPLNQEVLLFLDKDEVTKDIVVYFPDIEPHSFLIKDGKLYTFGNSADLAKSFAKGAGAADKGIDLAGAKKEMGVK